MTTYADNLDGTSGDLLRNRSGWSRTVGSSEVTLTAGASGYYMTGGTLAGSGTWHAPTSQPAGDDQYAEAIIHVGSDNQPFPLGVRCDTSSATGGGYLARIGGSNALQVYRRASGGSLLLLGSYTIPTPSDLDTNKVRLEAVGTSISAWFKGARVVGPITNSDFASGSVAMLSRGGTATSTANTVDDWGSGDTAAAGLTADGAGQIDLSGGADGAVLLAAVCDGAFPITGAAAAGVLAVAGGAGTFSLTGQASAAGTVGPNIASASGSLVLNGAALVIARITGAASGAIALEGAADAVLVPLPGANASGAISVAGSATGAVRVVASASGGLSFTGTTATGVVLRLVGTGALNLSGASTIGTAGADEQYPLAGQSQARPLAGRAQTYPLYGRAA